MDLPKESELIRRRFRVRRALIKMGVDERDALAAALAWEGKSNTEIGDALKIGKERISHILGRVYKELGFKGHAMIKRGMLLRMFRNPEFHMEKREWDLLLPVGLVKKS